jgi:hypothetical protein
VAAGSLRAPYRESLGRRWRRVPLNAFPGLCQKGLSFKSSFPRANEGIGCLNADRYTFCCQEFGAAAIHAMQSHAQEVWTCPDSVDSFSLRLLPPPSPIG